jgi:hypothetical protein
MRERAKAHLLLGTTSGTSTNNDRCRFILVILLPRLLSLKVAVLSQRLSQGVVKPVLIASTAFLFPDLSWPRALSFTRETGIYGSSESKVNMKASMERDIIIFENSIGL